MESMKDTTTGKDIFECVKIALRTMITAEHDLCY